MVTREINGKTKHMICKTCNDNHWIETKNGLIPCECMRDDIRKARLLRAGLKESELDITMKSITELNCKKGREIKERVQWYCDNFKDNMEKGIHGKRNLRGWGLILGGKIGSGKSFLGKAIVRDAIDKGYEAKIITVHDLVANIKACFDNKTTSTKQYVSFVKDNYDLLVLDETGASVRAVDSYIHDTLMEILDSRYDANKPTIVITNNSQDSLERLLDNRIWSRLRGKCWWISFDDLPDLRIRNKPKMTDLMAEK